MGGGWKGVFYPMCLMTGNRCSHAHRTECIDVVRDAYLAHAAGVGPAARGRGVR